MKTKYLIVVVVALSSSLAWGGRHCALVNPADGLIRNANQLSERFRTEIASARQDLTRVRGSLSPQSAIQLMDRGIAAFRDEARRRVTALQRLGETTAENSVASKCLNLAQAIDDFALSMKRERDGVFPPGCSSENVCKRSFRMLHASFKDNLNSCFGDSLTNAGDFSLNDIVKDLIPDSPQEVLGSLMQAGLSLITQRLTRGITEARDTYRRGISTLRFISESAKSDFEEALTQVREVPINEHASCQIENEIAKNTCGSFYAKAILEKALPCTGGVGIVCNLKGLVSSLPSGGSCDLLKIELGKARDSQIEKLALECHARMIGVEVAEVTPLDAEVPATVMNAVGDCVARSSQTGASALTGCIDGKSTSSGAPLTVAAVINHMSKIDASSVSRFNPNQNLDAQYQPGSTNVLSPEGIANSLAARLALAVSQQKDGYLASASAAEHLAICQEVKDFLSTSTTSSFFEVATEPLKTIYNQLCTAQAQRLTCYAEHVSRGSGPVAATAGGESLSPEVRGILSNWRQETQPALTIASFCQQKQATTEALEKLTDARFLAAVNVDLVSACSPSSNTNGGENSGPTGGATQR